MAKFLTLGAGKQKLHSETADTLQIKSLGVGLSAPEESGVEVSGTVKADFIEGEVVSGGDYAFTDQTCPVCGQELSVGDDVVFTICRQELMKDGRTRSFCVPIHVDCREGTSE
jgi:hypothetical protein